MSARLLAGAGAVLRREGLVRALDLCGQRRVASMALGSAPSTRCTGSRRHLKLRRIATLHLGAHSETHAQSLDSSPFLCHVVESSHSSALGGILALKNEYIVAWAWFAARSS